MGNPLWATMARDVDDFKYGASPYDNPTQTVELEALFVRIFRLLADKSTVERPDPLRMEVMDWLKTWNAELVAFMKRDRETRENMLTWNTWLREARGLPPRQCPTVH